MTTPAADPAPLGLAAFALLSAIPFGAGYAVSQSLIHPSMRATSASIMYLLTNLVGYGLGAPSIGFGSDRMGSGHLGAAMLIVCAANLLAALLYWMAAATLSDNLRRADTAAASPAGTIA